MLGPGDLRVSLGLPSRKMGDSDDPRFLAAVDDLIQVSEKHQTPLMTVAFKLSSKSDTWITKFQMLLASADFVNVVRGQQEDLAITKRLLADMLGEENHQNGVNGANGANKAKDGYHGNGIKQWP